MSELSQLQGKGKIFKIGGVDLNLKPLTVDELELFSIDDKAPLEQQMENSKKLISAILRKSVPNATEDEIKGISLEYLNDLMEAITKLHKIEKIDEIKKIKDVISTKGQGAGQQ